jgi:uncharacterized membrane protein
LVKLNYILFLFVPLAFTSIFSPALLLTGAFSFFSLILSGKEDHLIGLTHRNVSLLPSLILASIFGIAWLSRKIKVKPNTVYLFCTSSILIINILLLIGFQSTQLAFKDTLISNYSPAKIEAVKEAMRLIPPNASLVASWRLGTHLANRKNLYTIDTPYRYTADYIFVNSEPDISCESKYNTNQQSSDLAKDNQKYLPKSCEAFPEEYKGYLEEIKNNQNYKLIFEKEEIFLFKKINIPAEL